MSKGLIPPPDKFLKMFYDMPRIFLWKKRCDYKHGTSHGVGHASLVHESLAFDEIIPHQTFSIEPGVYFKDEFGIRIEDVVMSVCNDYVKVLDFTYIPLQIDLIDVKMLNDDEMIYLKEYLGNVNAILSECLEDEEMKWLNEKKKK